MVCGKIPPHPPALKRSSQYHSAEHSCYLGSRLVHPVSGPVFDDVSSRRELGYKHSTALRQQQKTTFFTFFYEDKKNEGFSR